jgi:hypothetical protein
MSKNLIISELRAQANAEWSALSGDAVGGKKEDFVGFAGGYSRMEGVRKDPAMKILTVTITNTDTKALSAALFGANEGFIQPFNGVGSLPGTTIDFITKETPAAGRGIIVEYKRYSIAEINNLSRSNPFQIAGYRYEFGDEAQLKQEFYTRRKEGTAIIDDIHTPFERRNLANNVQTAMDNNDFYMLVDDKATLFVVLAPALDASTPRKVQISFNIGAEIELASALKRQGVVKVNGSM